ncbi:hypothetical protein V8F20_012282 [Naviculisporaceae sp. PSN 640]
MGYQLHPRLCATRVLSLRLSFLKFPSQGTMSLSTAASAQNPEWKRRKVVSNFIFDLETDDGKPRVALFRRSGQVSTYQHHLAPISGSIEKDDASPLAAAWREIKEETTLTPASLALIRQGKSYTFSDPSIRREWTIFPFAFRLRHPKDGIDPGNQINIDWEHESWDWYDPLTVEDSDAFGGVPRLNESLRRVWFEKDLGGEAAKVLADGLNKLANDFTSGARQMAGDALEILRDVIKALPSENNADSESWWTNVRFAAWHIWKNGRESMGAAILSALLSALTEIEQTLSDGFEARTRRCVAIIAQQIAARNEAAHLVSQSLVTYIDRVFDKDQHPRQTLSILTLSESSTIYHALSKLMALSPDRTLDIRILESRPLFEGVSLASKLVHLDNSNRHKITLFTDGSAALASQNVDIVLVGADRVASNGSVSNKTGTLPAVLSARYITSATPTSKPAKVLVLTESDKIAPSVPGDEYKPENHVTESGDPSQIIRAWQSPGALARIQAAAAKITQASHAGSGETNDADGHVQVQNISFEWCPAELVDGYITEQGEWTVEDIARHAAKAGREEARIFGRL